jgi:transposase
MGLDFRNIEQAPEKSTNALLEENKRLWARIQDLEHHVLELTTELETLCDENAALKESLNVEIKSRQIAEEEKQRQKRQQKRERQNSEKKRGAPQGHRGATRSKPDHFDEDRLYSLDHCPNCSADKDNITIYNETVVYEERIIPQKRYVKKKIRQHGYCNICHQKISAYVPDGMYHFHPETQAIIAAKQIEERLTFRLIENSFDTFSDFHITPQGALNVFERVGTILLPVYDYLGHLLRDTAYLYADETTWPINGIKKWSWYFGNELISYYQFATSRSQTVPQNILGKTYDGILIIDGYKGYKIICLIQRCWIHLNGKIEKLIEMPFITETGKQFLLDLHKNVSQPILRIHKQFRENEISKPKYQKLGNEIKSKYFELVDNTSVLSQIRDKKIINWLKEREKEKDQLFTFIDYPEIKVHTNDAESALRPEVIYRKISGGHRTEDGAQNYAIIMSIWQTCKKNNINFFDYYQKVHLWYYDGKIGPPPNIIKNNL